MRARRVLLAAALLLAACQTPKPKPPPPPPALFPAEWTVVDLTRPLDGDAPYLEHERAYPFERVPVARTEDRDWRTGSFSGLEHQGTHLSSAATRVEDGVGIDALAAGDLLVGAVVLDASGPETGTAAVLTAADVTAHEQLWGKIPAGSIALLRRPTVDAEALALLVTRKVVAIGTQATTLDPGDPPGEDGEDAGGGSGDVAASGIERAAQTDGMWLLLNLADLSALPPRGALVLAGALPIRGAAGAPARVLAFIPPDDRLPKRLARPPARQVK